MFGHLGFVTKIVLLLSENHSETELAFDIEQFETIKSEAETTRTDIQSMATTLRDTIDQLRNDWKTPAGTEFFKNLDTEWEDQVNKYVQTMEVFIELMDNLITAFTAIQEEAEAIRLPD